MRLLFILLTIMLSACASKIPPAISQATVDEASFSAVLNAPSKYRDQRVRFGGLVIDVNNRRTTTELEILVLPLQDDGKPEIAEKPLGRLIAVIEGFIDPESIEKESRVAVVGYVDGMREKKIDEYMYQYPLIKVKHWYDWGKYTEPKYYHDPFYPPFYHFPWYYPRYPVRPYPMPKSVKE